MTTYRSRLALIVLSLAALVALLTAATLAVFTDQEQLGANSFSTGSVSLSTSPTTALVTIADMMPGDSVTNPIVVSNSGGGALRYAVSSTATNTDSKALKDQLVLTVKTVDVDGVTCGSWDGTQLYTGDLDSTAGKLIGDAATGQDGLSATGGDRALAAGASETLCFRVSLPTATGNAFASATTTATFTFDAEQTKNN